MSSELDGDTKENTGIIAVKHTVLKPPTQIIRPPSIDGAESFGRAINLTAVIAIKSKTSDANLVILEADGLREAIAALEVQNTPHYLRLTTLEHRLNDACQCLMLPIEIFHAQYAHFSLTEFETAVEWWESVAVRLKQYPQEATHLLEVAARLMYTTDRIWQPGQTLLLTSENKKPQAPMLSPAEQNWLIIIRQSEYEYYHRSKKYIRFCLDYELAKGTYEFYKAKFNKEPSINLMLWATEGGRPPDADQRFQDALKRLKQP